MSILRSVVILLLIAAPTHAQSFPHKVVHFFAKHELATAIVVTGLSFAAESASAVHCHRTDSECYYTPNETGLHYTTGKIIGYDALLAGGVSLGELAVYHWGKKQDPQDGGHLVWFVAAPVAAVETSFTIRNTRPVDTDLESFAPVGDILRVGAPHGR